MMIKTGFLYVTETGNLLPFQFIENHKNLILDDKIVERDKLPTFFTQPVTSSSDISTVVVRKFNFAALQKASNYTELVAAIESTDTLATPSNYIESFDKGSKRIFASLGTESLVSNLVCGWYQVFFTDETYNFVTDVFYCEG